jgi:GntR family transcriptional repressor for pyruvate dehydrogenase complex
VQHGKCVVLGSPLCETAFDVADQAEYDIVWSYGIPNTNLTLMGTSPRKMPTDNTSQPNDLFQAIPRASTLATRVTRQIERLIVEGQLQPGERLPPERTLAHQFGVSRTVVREAVRALVAKSLLEVRPGSGTIVRSPSTQSVAQSMKLLLRAGRRELDYDKVHEIRRLLEVEIAGLAAERRTSDDLSKLEGILDQAARIQDNRDEFAQSDVDFHAALASATHNELFSLVLDSLVDIMLQVRQLAFGVSDMPSRALKYHQAILEQVKAGDPSRARQAMREHLVESEETMRQALAQELDRLSKTTDSLADSASTE